MDKSNSEDYNLNLLENNTVEVPNNQKLCKWYWHTNPLLLEKLKEWIKKNNILTIVDIGCGKIPFPLATHLIDYNIEPMSDKITWKADLDYDKFSLLSKVYDMSYCRHTLEDLQNPHNAFNEITRISKTGYIETPSPIVEITKGVNDDNIRGYIHHRYIVWSELETNTLCFLPKYPVIENTITPENFIHILNNYPLYWNNYYTWSLQNPPNIRVYRNDVNFEICKDYANLLNKAILSSINYTNHFIKSL